MQDFTNFNQSPKAFTEVSENSEAAFFQRVYAWMFIALGVTAGLGFLLSRSAAWIHFIFSIPTLGFLVVALLPMGIAWYMGSRLDSLSTTAVKGCLLAIAAIFGATTLTVCFVVYPTAAFVKAFVCASAIYGAMAVYGLVTKRSLQALGAFLYMGLFGLIIASIVNFFTQSDGMDFVICVIGVLIFSGLTAYDHQKLRVMFFSANSEGADDDTLVRYALMGSLMLYLDFLNIFLFLLRLFGRGND